METVPFVIERTYNATADRVWQAITDRDKMEQWYFKLKEFKPEVGFEFEFEGGPPEKTFLHLCKVIEVIPGKKLTHSWRYDGYEGNSFVTWEVFDEGDKTRVKLTHAGLETFPAIPDFAKENFVMGWTDILGRMLKEYLEKA
ncbi:SRPBCC family protein [Mucilaginibacter flavidus]|uniref:SRPBCC family protein n=1 Tax=Mucilaginibacter flavidus TaxID=2949309 RepID=UPI00209372D0|nr:SRPBCC domain-containing protein [Mucilaginibacter flavidus]MCO5948125.1 SRPBCC domain-containing protein [Mucilaginibacter flavidus]